MKHIAFACGVLALSACAQNAEINTRNSDLPGIQTEIDCNPEPTLIFAKTGQLIEKVYPILHPSCVAAANRAANSQLEEEIRPHTSISLGSKIANLLKLGPASKKSSSKLEADEDKQRTLASNDGFSSETATKEESKPVGAASETGSSSNPEGNDPSDTDTTPNDGDPSDGGATPTGDGNSSGEESTPQEENTPSEENSQNEEGEGTEEASSEEQANNEESPAEEAATEEEGSSEGERNSEEESSSEEESPAEEEENASEEPKTELTKIEKLKQHAGVDF